MALGHVIGYVVARAIAHNMVGDEDSGASELVVGMNVNVRCCLVHRRSSCAGARYSVAVATQYTTLLNVTILEILTYIL